MTSRAHGLKTVPGPAVRRDADSLRRRAEARLRRSPLGRRLHRAGPEDRALRHELAVHQVELEMQNEQLVEARREAEARAKEYGDLYDFAPNGYATLARDGTIRRINLTGAGLLGRERSVLVGRNLRAQLDGEALGVFASFLEEVFKREAAQSCEVGLRELSSRRAARILRLSAAVPRQASECRIAMEDVSGRRRMERELAQAAQLRMGVISLVNHEYANELTNQRLALALLKDSEDSEVDEPRRHAYEALERSLDRLRDYTANFLNLHRLESGEFEIKRRPVRIQPVLQGCLAAALPLALAKRQRLTLDVDPACRDAAVLVDVQCLSVIVSNLLNNAVKYTAADGEVRLRLSAEPDHVRVSVQDNGIGLGFEEVSKVCEGFYRAPHGREVAKGFGVGLVVVRRLLQGHDSRLEIESRPGKGSVFSFRLPLWRGDGAESSDTP